MIHDIKKEEAINTLTFRIQNLVSVLAQMDRNHESSMTATDVLTFQRLVMIRADIDAIAAVTGADRVEYDKDSKRYYWNPKDQVPDGQWQSQGYGHESMTLNGHRVDVKAKGGKSPDVEWWIQKDGIEVLRGIVFRLPNINPMELAKESSTIAVKRITDEKEA